MASLTSLLFKSSRKQQNVDSELDDIFRTSAGSVQPPVLEPVTAADTPTKRKAVDVSAPVEDSRKRAKRDKQTSTSTSVDIEVARPKHRTSASTVNSTGDGRPSKKTKKSASTFAESSDEDEAQSTVHAGSSKRSAPSPDPSSSSDGSGKEDEDEDEDDEDAPPPTHISLLPAAKSDLPRKKQKAQFTPNDETPSQRDARTVFIGNLPIDVAKNKLARKQLMRHLTACVPGSKVESIRFRSVAFQNPTAALPQSDDETPSRKNPAQPSKEKDLSTKEKRSKTRAANWREDQDKDAAEADANKKKQYLTPSEKKKIAFIHKEFHSEADTTNAYAVFAYPDPSSEDPTAPDEVAQRAVEACDASVFLERTIRVDRVGASAGARTDTKRSIFVGNLDFAAKEEDLRVFFESLLATERGPVPVSEDGAPKTWVTHVRLVRDPGTQLGKGFAYVEFMDRECVDEILALEQTRLKFAKRKLRVQRCKANQQASTKVAPKSKLPASVPIDGNTKARKILDPSHFVSRPKRDYDARAAELASLSKDERKNAKAADPDRIARRLQKKKARHILGTGAVDAQGGKGLLGKKRPKTGPGAKAKAPRMRSEKAVAKRNAKK